MLILPPALSNTNKFSRDETTCVASLISMGENVDDSIPPPPSLFSSSTTVAQKIRQARLEREMSPSPMSVSSSENSLLELSIPSPALRSSSTTVLKKRAYSDGSENQSHVSEYSNNCAPSPALRSSSITDVIKQIKDIPKDYNDRQCPLPLPRALRSVSSATVLRLLEKMEENAKLDLSGLQTDCSKYFTSEYCSTSLTSKNHTSQTKICDGNSPLLPPPPMLRSSSGKTVSYGSSLEMSSIKHKPPMFGFNSDTNSVGVKDAKCCHLHQLFAVGQVLAWRMYLLKDLVVTKYPPFQLHCCEARWVELVSLRQHFDIASYVVFDLINVFSQHNICEPHNTRLHYLPL